MRNPLFWIAAFLPLLLVLGPAVRFLLSLNLPVGSLFESAAVALAAIMLLSTSEDRAFGSEA
jgi:hypothetical protein